MLWLLFLATPQLVAAQNIDSLKLKLTEELSPAERIDILYDLSNYYLYRDIDQSESFSKEIIRIATENKLSAFRGYSQIAAVLRARGDFFSAVKEDNKALEELFKQGAMDSTALASVLNNLGDDYYDLGEYDDAYDYFTRSYRIANKINHKLSKAIAMHNVGRVFKSLGMFDHAREHFRLSRELSRVAEDMYGEAYYFDEMGDLLFQIGKYDSALTYQLQAVRMARVQSLFDILPRSHLTLAQSYLNKGDFRLATAHLDSSDAIYNTTNDNFGIATNNLIRGLLSQKQKNFSAARNYFLGSLQTAETLNAPTLAIQGYKSLSSLEESTGDFKNALMHFQKFKMVEDSLFNQDTQVKLLRDQVSMASQASDTRIQQLSEERSRQEEQLKKQEFQRNILVVVMALTGILLVTVYRSGQRRRKINLLLIQHQDEMKKREVELERLNQVKDKFFSIISHDLRSPINALAGMLDLLDKGAIAQEELPTHIRELKSRFNHTRTLLNNLLDWTLLQMDKLNLQASKIDLHKIVEENIQLLGSMQSKNIHLKNLTPVQSLAFADSNTINLVIRNLLTNALKFTNDGGTIEVKAEEAGFEWKVEVRDNGVGINPDVLKILFDKTAPYTTRGTANEKGTGLGLILCKEFVEKNGGRIWVESEENRGSSFFFTIPKAS